MKKKLLFIGITMNSAGTEQSFLSFVSCIDFNRFDVDLLLAKKEGLFLDLIPPEVNVKVMPEYGDLFLLSGKNAVKLLSNTFLKKNPLYIFKILPSFIKQLIPQKRVQAAIELFCKLMKKIKPIAGEYDAALAYWGDRTMFYMIDKVPNARKKIAWMHFDYSTPPRDDKIYLDYFKKCDNIINVSGAVDNALKEKFPEIAKKCVVISNIQNAAFIRKRSLEGKTFEDEYYKGKRILTVGRFAEQKGLDFIPQILRCFKDNKMDVRWYILGDGDDAYKTRVLDLAIKLDVAEMMFYLGTTTNPYPLMRDCDVYVQPSRYEGKPISVEEAKIMRCPIVIANYLSAAEQLENGHYGLIAKIDAFDLYEKIKLMLDDDKLREKYIKTLADLNFGNESEINKFYSLL